MSRSLHSIPLRAFAGQAAHAVSSVVRNVVVVVVVVVVVSWPTPGGEGKL